MIFFTAEKFAALTPKRQHKHAARLLKEILEGNAPPTCYTTLGKWPLPVTTEELCNRFHWHLKKANLHFSEHQLPQVKHFDHSEGAPFLPIDIYLDNLRSAHNVGGIIRTAEAFRIGEIYLGGYTPKVHGGKSQKTSMGAEKFVHCWEDVSFSHLTKRPFIALETAEGAENLYDFTFPSSFTLILGNEEVGVSRELLSQVDHIVEIPLVGAKNSLNVASTFAIACSFIRKSSVLLEKID